MFLVDWILRLSFRCYSLDRSWPYPVDGRMMEHLYKEQERQLLQKERRREATELEMELLLCYRAGFGVEYIAPAVKAVVEVVVPNGVDERVGKGIEEVQRLAQSFVGFRAERDHIEPKDYYRYRRRFYFSCLRRIIEASYTASVHLVRDVVTSLSTAPKPTSAHFANAIHDILSQYDVNVLPYTADEQIESVSSLFADTLLLIPWALRARFDQHFLLPSPWRQQPFDFDKPERPDRALRQRADREAIRSNQYPCREGSWGRGPRCRGLICWRGCGESAEGKARKERQPGLEQDFWIVLVEGLEERKRSLREWRAAEAQRKAVAWW